MLAEMFKKKHFLILEIFVPGHARWYLAYGNFGFSGFVKLAKLEIFFRIYFFLMLLFLLSLCSDSSSSNTPTKKTFADVINCSDSLSVAQNTNITQMVQQEKKGLTAKHGFNVDSWEKSGSDAMFSAGISAAYINDDCWPDIIFASGDESGMVVYINKGQQQGFVNKSNLLSGTTPSSVYKLFTGVAVADLNGNYKRELVFGNLFAGSVVIMSFDEKINKYYEFDRLPVSRSTYGISFGDINKNGWLDMFLAHWSFEEADNTSPALWTNSGDGKLVPFDKKGGTSHPILDQQFNFTPLFGDLRDSGLQDLLVVSDFGTSAVLSNNGDGTFTVVTDSNIIDDESGMGGALGDVNNNGKLDWFVTSIFDPNGIAEGNWGVTGNRLYQNNSTKAEIIFSNITEQSGTRDGNWGWGVCMSDFNNDGFLDIFHVNGFGYVPAHIKEFVDISEDFDDAIAEFVDTIPRLFINNGDGTFTDQTVEWGLDVPSEGRGVTCFDYDRDGDIDIALVDHSTGIQFFENQTGHGKGKRFLNIRLVGEPPNTDAIGAKVYVTADVGNGHGVQRQMRVSHANNSYSSQNLPDIHFGVGEAKSVDYLRIEWTDDSGLLCENVASNQFLIFDQRDKSWPKSDSKYPVCHWYESINSVLQG